MSRVRFNIFLDDEDSFDQLCQRARGTNKNRMLEILNQEENPKTEEKPAEEGKSEPTPAQNEENPKTEEKPAEEEKSETTPAQNKEEKLETEEKPAEEVLSEPTPSQNENPEPTEEDIVALCRNIATLAVQRKI